MRRKTVGYIAVVFAAMFLVSVFSFSAFAETKVPDGQTTTAEAGENGQTVTQEQDDTKAQGNGEQDNQQRGENTTGDEGTKTGNQTGGEAGSVGRESDDGKILVTFNLNGGKGMHTSAKVSKGTTVSEFKTPTRKGYRFAGWLLDGSQVSGSKTLNSPVTLTAAWTKEVSSEAAVSVASVSEPPQSDDGTLSSQDWGTLLAGESSGSVSSAVSSAAVSSEAQQAGGVSSMFLAGVLLVALGAAGVGTFVYLQFIRGRGGKGGPRGPGGSGGATDDTIVFTDVSSYSDGKKHNSELSGAVRQPVPPEKPDTRAAENPAAPHGTEMAQAKPVQGSDSNFDWEKFFNEEERGGR